MPASDSPEPTISDLRARAEQSRARLTSTVEDLRTQVDSTATDLKERLSPSAIKADVVDYMRNSRDQFWARVEEGARKNPLQAVAIGAAVAYPAFKLLRAVPAPLLLIGAGLFLSRTSGQPPEALGSATDAAVAKARGAVDKAGGAIGRASDAARRTLHDTTDVIKDAAGKAIDRTSASVSALSEGVTGAADTANVGASETFGEIKSQDESPTQKARHTVNATLEQNPLVVAGIGLALGAVLAATFPATKAEKVVVGGAKDALRRATGEVAAKGVGVMQDAIGKATTAASEEGLSVEGINAAGDTLQEKLRSVAEKGVEAALNQLPDPDNHGSSPSPETKA